jgi:hypothetical protein
MTNNKKLENCNNNNKKNGNELMTTTDKNKEKCNDQ